MSTSQTSNHPGCQHPTHPFQHAKHPIIRDVNIPSIQSRGVSTSYTPLFRLTPIRTRSDRIQQPWVYQYQLGRLSTVPPPLLKRFSPQCVQTRWLLAFCHLTKAWTWDRVQACPLGHRAKGSKGSKRDRRVWVERVPTR